MELIKNIYESTKPLIWLLIVGWIIAIAGVASYGQQYKQSIFNGTTMTHIYLNKNNVQINVMFECTKQEYKHYCHGEIPSDNRKYLVTIQSKTVIISRKTLLKYAKVANSANSN